MAAKAKTGVGPDDSEELMRWNLSPAHFETISRKVTIEQDSFFVVTGEFNTRRGPVNKPVQALPPGEHAHTCQLEAERQVS